MKELGKAGRNAWARSVFSPSTFFSLPRRAGGVSGGPAARLGCDFGDAEHQPARECQQLPVGNVSPPRQSQQQFGEGRDIFTFLYQTAPVLTSPLLGFKSRPPEAKGWVLAHCSAERL